MNECRAPKTNKNVLDLVEAAELYRENSAAIEDRVQELTWRLLQRFLSSGGS